MKKPGTDSGTGDDPERLQRFRRTAGSCTSLRKYGKTLLTWKTEKSVMEDNREMLEMIRLLRGPGPMDIVE